MRRSLLAFRAVLLLLYVMWSVLNLCVEIMTKSLEVLPKCAPFSCLFKNEFFYHSACFISPHYNSQNIRTAVAGMLSWEFANKRQLVKKIKEKWKFQNKSNLKAKWRNEWNALLFVASFELKYVNKNMIHNKH